jgi:putative nucleotidyltransferase with HDIG domain
MKVPELVKIAGVESDTRKLHYYCNGSESTPKFSRLNPLVTFTGFWDFHVKPVINLSRQMAKKYEADETICWLAAILHDIARLDGAEPHDLVGAQKALEILKSKRYPEEIAQAAAQAVLCHRCRNYPPQTIEQKILASADAIAHFQAPFYLWWSSITNQSFKEQLKSMETKLERDFNDKIFFDEEKEAVRGHYEVMKSWLNAQGEE